MSKTKMSLKGNSECIQLPQASNIQLSVWDWGELKRNLHRTIRRRSCTGMLTRSIWEGNGCILSALVSNWRHGDRVAEGHTGHCTIVHDTMHIHILFWAGCYGERNRMEIDISDTTQALSRHANMRADMMIERSTEVSMACCWVWSECR